MYFIFGVQWCRAHLHVLPHDICNKYGKNWEIPIRVFRYLKREGTTLNNKWTIFLSLAKASNWYVTAGIIPGEVLDAAADAPAVVQYLRQHVIQPPSTLPYNLKHGTQHDPSDGQAAIIDGLLGHMVCCRSPAPHGMLPQPSTTWYVAAAQHHLKQRSIPPSPREDGKVNIINIIACWGKKIIILWCCFLEYIFPFTILFHECQYWNHITADDLVIRYSDHHQCYYLVDRRTLLINYQPRLQMVITSYAREM